MQILYSQKAVKQLKRINRGDKKNTGIIIAGIENYAKNPKVKNDIKILKGELGEFKRLRIGNYRVIFDDKNRVMFIYKIKHRQGAYNG